MKPMIPDFKFVEENGNHTMEIWQGDILRARVSVDDAEDIRILYSKMAKAHSTLTSLYIRSRRWDVLT